MSTLDLPSILDAIGQRPEEERRWLVLAGWLRDHGRDDEAAAVRVYWPTLRDKILMAGVSLRGTMRQVGRSSHTAESTRSCPALGAVSRRAFPREANPLLPGHAVLDRVQVRVSLALFQFDLDRVRFGISVLSDASYLPGDLQPGLAPRDPKTVVGDLRRYM